MRKGKRAIGWADILRRSHGPRVCYAAPRAASPFLDGSLRFTFDDGKRTVDDGNRHNGDLVIASRVLQGVGEP